MNLDGKDTIEPVPFDAAEQVLHQPHRHHPRLGYIPVDYEHQEYPKVIGTSDSGEPIIAESEEHHEQLMEAGAEKPVAIDETVNSLVPVPPAPPVPAAAPQAAQVNVSVIPIAEDPNKSEE